MANALAKKGSLFWLMIFSFALGFSTTIAEPALIAIAKEASEISSDAGLIDKNPTSLRAYALGLTTVGRLLCRLSYCNWRASNT